MPERVADAIEEIARPSRGEQPGKPQIHADPAKRRPRLLRNTPGAVVAALVLAAAAASGWATFWLLGLPAVSDRPGLAVLGRLPIRVALAVVAALVDAGLVAWVFRPAQTLRRTVRSVLAASRRRTARVPLFVSVAAAVLVGIGLAALGSRAVSGTFFQRATPATALEVLKAALPALVGIAVAVALVVAYRRQKDSERGQFAQRFGAASAQLGDSDVAVRIAGVYAMAAVADESPAFANRQQCIDVLCGYLRLPYDPDSGDNHLSEFVSTTTWKATPPATGIQEERRQAIRQNDREVRKTIVRVVTGHLQGSADTSWSRNDFDLTGVLMEDASFDGALFSGRTVSFDGSTFTGQKTSFDGARFHAEKVCFTGAQFESGATTFDGSSFAARTTLFVGATFGGQTTAFDRVTFGGEYVSFVGARFSSEKATFTDARFKCLRASFDAPTEWTNVDFDWDNPSGETTPVIPRCITPRPWPPTLDDEE